MMDYEAIVIGAGIIGSSTAYYLAKELGSKVLLLEQFDFLHRKGSSHGDSRIIRYTYPQDYYTRLMFDAYKLWGEAEIEFGSKILTKTGGLDFGRKDNPILKELIEGAKKFGVTHKVFNDSKEFAKAFPMLTLEDGELAVFCPQAGILNATKAVGMFQQLAKSNGCILKDNCQVTDVKQEGKAIIVRAKDGMTYSTRKCVMTCGPWAKKMLKSVANLDIPLKPKELTVAYWKVDNPEVYSSKSFPVFIHYDEPFLYGTPCHEFPNLIKCCAEGVGQIDPDKRTFKADFDGLNKIVPWMQKVFKGVSREPQITESCIITETPDMDFVIDECGFEGLFVGCGFSGHGFKLGPVVGQLLAKWTITGEFPRDKFLKDIFSLSRFEK